MMGNAGAAAGVNPVIVYSAIASAILPMLIAK